MRLCEFGEKYIAVVEKRVSQVKDADEQGVKYARNLVTSIALEKYLQNIYTNSKFQAIQEQCECLVYCYFREEREIGYNLLEYVIEDHIWNTCKGGSGEYLTPLRRMYRAVFNSESKDIECNYKLFITHGILCRHTLHILDMTLVEEALKQYVLRRWRKDVVRKHSLVKVCCHDPSKTPEIKRYDKMNVAFDPIAYKDARSDKGVDIVLRGLQRIQVELRQSSSNSNIEHEDSTPPTSIAFD